MQGVHPVCDVVVEQPLLAKQAKRPGGLCVVHAQHSLSTIRVKGRGEDGKKLQVRALVLGNRAKGQLHCCCRVWWISFDGVTYILSI